MVKEFEIYHGIVFSKLIHKFGEIKVHSLVNNDNSSYVINDSMGIYIKFSKKRLTPWQFTFSSEHYNSIGSLYSQYKKVYIILVCNEDGICCIKYEDFINVISCIDENNSKSILISRVKNEQYSVSGTDGALKHKIPDNNISY
jgi:hypothetical protein